MASAGSGDAPGEACRFPASASLKGCTEENSVFVDDFLYDDDALEALYDADPPKLSRSYCNPPSSPSLAQPNTVSSILQRPLCARPLPPFAQLAEQRP